MAADLESLLPTRVADTRYVTLTNLYNACTGDARFQDFHDTLAIRQPPFSHSSRR